jgi:hypothetical protein
MLLIQSKKGVFASTTWKIILPSGIDTIIIPSKIISPLLNLILYYFIIEISNWIKGLIC